MKLTTLGRITVTTAGTRVPLTADTTLIAYKVIIKGKATNAGLVFVGDVTVTATNGYPLAATAELVIEPPTSPRNLENIMLSDIYVDSATNGDSVQVLYVAARP